MSDFIYKIVDCQTWQTAELAGEFAGSGIDVTDGFIHFSTAEQTQETADKHFSGRADLMLVKVDSNSLGESLVWEESRGGAMFPHLYGKLSMESVVAATTIRQDKNGRHLIEFS